jgi:hypothetical protein
LRDDTVYPTADLEFHPEIEFACANCRHGIVVRNPIPKMIDDLERLLGGDR